MTFARQQYYAFEDGKQAGIAEGLADGKQQKAIEDAENFLEYIDMDKYVKVRIKK